MDFSLASFERDAKRMFEGRIIKEVRYISDEEAGAVGLNNKGLVFTLDNGTLVWPVSDDEGNDSGAIHTSDNECRILPTFRCGAK